MRAHPYFSYFIIPFFKKKLFFFKFKAVRKWAGENPGKNQHAFLKSLDFLYGTKGNTEGEETDRQREIHVIGCQCVAGKSTYGRHIVLKDFQHLGPQMNCMWQANRE